ncbi:MAG: peptidase M42 [Candidatus Magasanikbacteria bacterium]|nr:peptidase M42 [Candidatus Magasanikbacteria bacterium]
MLIKKMSEEDFFLLQKIAEAPSPSNLEGALTYGVIHPIFKKLITENKKSWTIHSFIGNAGIVLKTERKKSNPLKIMLVGHSDKIRLQVKHIEADGKIKISSSSFLPTSLISNKVKLFSRKPDNPKEFNVFYGTIEGIPPIHLASQSLISGKKGVSSSALYLELGVYGSHADYKLKNLGIRPGDPIIFDRKIEKRLFTNIFSGPYLDNSVGCFTVVQLAKMFSKIQDLENIQLLFTISAQEEIGRYGSMVAVENFKPDILIAIDVSHDYVNTPNILWRNFPETEIGNGFTVVCGAMISPILNNILITESKKKSIPYQTVICSRDTGTDASSGVKVGRDTVAMSLGVPLRYMHTASELAHTGDIMSLQYAVYNLIQYINLKGLDKNYFVTNHPQLQKADKITQI